MATTTIKYHDLLEYDPQYGVLICRECQYAIQKSALQSHLLRHKIYRAERQMLLSSVAHLDILEPENVPLPAPTSQPIGALAIISGHGCMATECRYLCASFKRMRRHWSEIHDVNELPPNFSSFVRPVKLQTFFRGTKLKYFEVASSIVVAAREVPPPVTESDSDDDGDVDKRDDMERHDDQEHDVGVHDDREHDADIAMPPPPVPTISETPPTSLAVNLDLQTLTYFHHFTTTTSLTLPGPKTSQSVTLYWQTDVVFQALQSRWLMCGLLAISAGHMAALADNETIMRVHRDRLDGFFSEFSRGWNDAVGRELGAEAAVVEEETKKVGRQIGCILRCVIWSLDDSTRYKDIIPELLVPFPLESIMTTIRGISAPHFELHTSSVCNDDDDRQNESFAQASRILEMESSSNSGSSSTFSSSNANNAPPELLNHIHTLPHRMTGVFGKPESMQDFLASLSAIAILVECCNTSFASDDAAPWQGMVTWLSKVPHHFVDIVSHHNPAALVVLAHWAALLVRRAEHCGSWFLRGSSNAILVQIAEQLPDDNHAAQSMIGRLMT